ncbi:hypothetical protein B0O80DRAFT_230123 [Mortierella sp. GBAus27b]|nr:hypothetical protein BGX31_002646 [Mortierella sp. GBA43]KAI8359370.1 hypothetical protein B0O80DRAFT_230123 [Mortierella sp. GBAus27b]
MIRDESAFPQSDVITTATKGSITTDPSLGNNEALKLKQDLLSEKVRTENRERKKRWREQNEDRNKDNDLRCRVNKRAHKLFGRGDSEHKARWIEEEFEKRQLKRKEKERRRNPNAPSSVEPVPPPPPAKPSTVALSEHLTLQQQAQQVQQQAQRAQQEFQASQLANAQFDVTTVKTALALNDLVRKNGSHLDLAQLTGVLTDPNLARQLIEIGAQNSTPPSSMMVMNAPVKPDDKSSRILETDYPMDAVLTLMQLNGSWKA